MSRATGTAIALLLAGAAFAMGRFTAGPRSAEDPVEAVRDALATGENLARLARLTEALQALTPEEMEAAAAIYAREISTLGECDIAPFVDARAHFDAEQAVDGVAAWPYALRIGNRRPYGATDSIRSRGITRV